MNITTKSILSIINQNFWRQESFSEQNLIDCVSDWNGCTGERPTFNSEFDYPYKAVDGECSFDSSKAIGHVTSLVEVVENDENDLKEVVAEYGVASVCIFANNAQFKSYAGGILDDDGCLKVNYVDHGIAVVGYGTEGGIDFWIVRNSWGEDGYVRMISNRGNKCLIASVAFVAVDS